MSDAFHCRLCDKSIKIKFKKKHLILQYHEALSKSTISRYNVTNPNSLQMEDIVKKISKDYDEKFGLHSIICKCKIFFDYLTYNFKFKKMYNMYSYYYLIYY